MSIEAPTREEMTSLLGGDLYKVWLDLCELIERKYDMERLWNSGGKKWTYEYKYRRGGKTLCALYAREGCLGFMVILGRDERERFEAEKGSYSLEVQRVYEETQTYHDGKWLMFGLKDAKLFSDIERLLSIKRKPNRK